MTDQILKALHVTSSSEFNQSTIMKSNQDVITKCLSRVINLLDKNMELCKSAAAENDSLKNEQIQTQKEVIRSQ